MRVIINPIEDSALFDPSKEDPYGYHEENAQDQNNLIKPIPLLLLDHMKIDPHQIRESQHIGKGDHDYGPLADGLKNGKYLPVGNKIFQYKGKTS